MPIRRLSTFAMLVTTLLAGACAYQGGTADPFGRSLTWFSYLNGDDLRTSCGLSTPDRFRLVYNAVYVEQVRAYDVTASADGGGEMTVKVFGAAKPGQFSLSQPTDLLAPWRGTTANRRLDAGDLDRLRQSLRASNVYDPLAQRLELDSDSFYWVVSACTGGHFAFNAFRWPSDRFKAATFPSLLFGWDDTGVAVNPPRKVDPRLVHQASEGEDMRRAQRFNLAAEKDGLVGLAKLF